MSVSRTRGNASLSLPSRRRWTHVDPVLLRAEEGREVFGHCGKRRAARVLGGAVCWRGLGARRALRPSGCAAGGGVGAARDPRQERAGGGVIFFRHTLRPSFSLPPRRPLAPSASPPMAGQQHYVKAGRHPVLEAGYKVREGKGGGARLSPFRAGEGGSAGWRAPPAPRARSRSCSPPLSPPWRGRLCPQPVRARARAADAAPGAGTGGQKHSRAATPDCSPFSPLFSSSCAATRSTSRSCWAAPWSGSG